MTKTLLLELAINLFLKHFEWTVRHLLWLYFCYNFIDFLYVFLLLLLYLLLLFCLVQFDYVFDNLRIFTLENLTNTSVIWMDARREIWVDTRSILAFNRTTLFTWEETWLIFIAWLDWLNWGLFLWKSWGFNEIVWDIWWQSFLKLIVW